MAPPPPVSFGDGPPLEVAMDASVAAAESNGAGQIRRLRKDTAFRVENPGPPAYVEMEIQLSTLSGTHLVYLEVNGAAVTTVAGVSAVLGSDPPDRIALRATLQTGANLCRLRCQDAAELGTDRSHVHTVLHGEILVKRVARR